MPHTATDASRLNQAGTSPSPSRLVWEGHAPRWRWRARLVPATLLLIGLALRLGLAWQDHRVLLAEYVWSDDSFLALTIAKNLGLGHGMTSDGVHRTNGFQPLYVFLLAPVFAVVSPENLTLPIGFAATLLAVAGTASAGVFYLTALHLFSRTTALCVLFFFTISSYFVVMEVNGLETALYGLTMAGLLYYYVARFTTLEAPTPRNYVALGVLAGVAVLARIDAGILVLVMGLHHLGRWRGRMRAAAARLAMSAVACAAILSPWLLISWVSCRSVMPVSGGAVRFASTRLGWQAVGNYVGYAGPESFRPEHVPWQYYANNVLHLASLTVSLLPLTAHTQGVRPNYVGVRSIRFPCGRWVARNPWAASSILIAITVAAFVGPMVVRRGSANSPAGLGRVMFLRFAILGWFAAYAFYVFGPWYSNRYLYPVLAMLTLLSGGLIDSFLKLLGENRRLIRRLLLGVAAAAYSFLFACQSGHYYTTQFKQHEPDPYTPVLPWLERNSPPTAKIGAFQSGILSYFSKRTCINLDGVVNASALDALRRNRMWDYLHARGVEYLVDWPFLVERFLEFPEQHRNSLSLVHDDERMWVYRVNRR